MHNPHKADRKSYAQSFVNWMRHRVVPSQKGSVPRESVTMRMWRLRDKLSPRQRPCRRGRP